jgi:hypothetical protein
VLTRQDPRVDFAWGEAAPDPAVPPDQFSVRWTKTQWFGAGRYRFTTVTDDGVRLYIDNRRVIDEWHGQSGTEHTYVADLGEGNHAIKMEFYDGGGGALAMLAWDSTLDQTDESFHAQYWTFRREATICRAGLLPWHATSRRSITTGVGLTGRGNRR